MKLFQEAYFRSGFLRKWSFRSLCILGAWALSTSAFAGGIVANTTEASLDAALTGGGLVRFACNGVIGIANTKVIAANTTLDASGCTVMISGSNAVRLFVVSNNATLTLLNLNLSDGKSTAGGAVSLLSGTSLIATNCVFSNNVAAGFNGADGANADDTQQVGDGGNGTTGRGGAIYSLGTLTIVRSVFRTNSALGGNGGKGGNGRRDSPQTTKGGDGGDGATGQGGGVYCYASSVTTLISCYFENNIAQGGNGGAGGLGGGTGYFGDTGQGGQGGAGEGAGFCTRASNPSMLSCCTFSQNRAVGGNGQQGGTSSEVGQTGAKGGDALGGGVAIAGSNVVLNCTFFTNSVLGGIGGKGGDTINGSGAAGGNGGAGGKGCGGGLHSYDPSRSYLTNCTFAWCRCTGGAGADGGSGLGGSGSQGATGAVQGANINQAGLTLRIKNTILAYGSTSNAAGVISDGGYNLSSDASPTLSGGSHSTNNADPRLSLLALNGGFTPTCAISTNTSKAINFGDATGAPTTDQRGYTRWGACDIGAFEYNGSPIQTVTIGAYGPIASEDGETGSLTVSRMDSNAPSLTISYTISGSASNDVDYALITNKVTIPSNGYYGRVFIRPIGNGVSNLDRTVSLTLTPDPLYALDSLWTNATVTISDTSKLDLSKKWRRGNGSDVMYHSFVIPLDSQEGVALDRVGGNAASLFPGNRWTNNLYHFDATNAAAQTGTNNRIVFQNPLIAFGSRVGGSPLWLSNDYCFGIYAGRANANYGSALRIQVYARSNFSIVATTNLPIPDVMDTNQFTTFMNNGWTATYESFGLRTIMSTHPFSRWGLASEMPGYVLKHAATQTATNYYYVVEFKGISGFFEPLVLNASGSHDWSKLYVMEFAERPSSRVTFLDQPHFDGQPLPSVYQGKTLQELTNVSAALPDLSGLVPGDYRMIDASPELKRHPILDQFVKDMGSDPLALANYVQNEIGLTDPMDYDTNQAPLAAIYLGGVNRSALATFQEGQGSPLEQCALLVYLLRQANVPAAYVFPAENSLQMLDFQVSKLLQMQFRGALSESGQTNLPQLIALNYPWVAVYLTNQSRWVQVFPWLKDTEVVEGLNLYDYMPTNWNSGHKWLTKFVLGDTNIFSLSDSDQPLELLPKFIQKQLDTYHPGLSVDDVGVKVIHRRNLRSRWEDFPKPFSLSGTPSVWESLSTNLSLFDTLQIRAYSAAQTTNFVDTTEMRIADLHNRKLLLRFFKVGTNLHDMVLSLSPYVWTNTGRAVFGTNADPYAKLFATNRLSGADDQIRFRVAHRRLRMIPSGVTPNWRDNIWEFSWTESGLTNLGQVSVTEDSFRKGDLVAFCFDVGRVTSKMLNVHAEEMWRHNARAMISSTNCDPEVYQGTTAFLLGMSFFNYIDRFGEFNANLHKVRTFSTYQHGFGLIRPKRDSGGLLISNGVVNLIEPAIHVPVNGATFVFNNTLRPDSGRDYESAHYDWWLHEAVQGSAAEHGVLRSFYQTNSVSTVKLLQLVGNSMLRLNRSNYLAYGETSYGGTALKNHDSGTWGSIVAFLNDPADYAREVLMTPGTVTNGTYRGVGAFLLGFREFQSIVSGFNGGYSWQFPTPTFTDANAANLTVEPNPDDATTPYRLRTSSTASSSYYLSSAPADYSLSSVYESLNSGQLRADPAQVEAADAVNKLLGQEGGTTASGYELANDEGVVSSRTGVFHQALEWAYDPVNVMSGEFYIDEVDLALPGPMVLQVRRNYGSQNLVEGDFGFGWKINYVPFLSATLNDNVIYAAEMDGSVVAYRRQASGNTNVWVPSAQDNPSLNNNNTAGIGSLANLFNGRVELSSVNGTNTYILTGADGSKRTYVERSFAIGGFNRLRPYLSQWQDTRGNTCLFEYGEDSAQPDYGQLRRVQNSNGSYLGFYYDVYGHVIEAYCGDGRRLAYEYDHYGDLVKVTRPDSTELVYEYRHALANNVPYSTHLLIRELKPDGRVLQNDYDASRRVTNQWATVGPDLRLVRNASFLFTNNFQLTNLTATHTGLTVVLDYTNNATTYYYTNGLIRKIVDPLNRTNLQEWFEADTADGGYRRSLNWSEDKRGLRTFYKYDASGNVTNVALQGNLTGDGSTVQAVRAFRYNTNNLVTNAVAATGATTKYYYTNGWLLSRVERYPTNALSSSVVVETFDYYNVTNPINNNQWTLGLKRQHVRAAESIDAATVEWSHDFRGFVTNQLQRTGTDDPDVSTGFLYSERNELVEKADAAGRRVRFDYDAMGRLKYQEVLEAGQTVPLAGNYSYYDDNGELTWTDGPRSNPEDYIWRDYDGGGRRTVEIRWRSRAKADGSGVEAVPDSLAQAQGVADGLYAVSLRSYDPFNNETNVVDALGNSIQMQYDAIGQMTTQVFYDSNRVPLATKTLTYEPGGQVARAINPLGGTTEFYYSATGQLIERRNPDGSVNLWRFYPDGRLKREILVNGNYWETTYQDELRQVTRTFYTSQGTALATNISVFDRRGNSVTEQDANGFTFTKAYDGLDRLKIAIGPGGASPQQTVQYYYDSAGMVSTSVNGLNETNLVTKDALGRVTSTAVYGAGGIGLVRYSASGYAVDHNSVTTVQGWGNGSLTNTVFTDTFGSPVLNVSGIAGEFTLNTYDRLGNLVAARDELNRTRTYAYDGFNRRAVTVLPDGATNRLAYDPAGNVLTNFMPGGLQSVSLYDSASRLLTNWLQQGTNRVNPYGYTYYTNESIGLLQRVVDGRGVARTYSYDEWLRLRNLSWSDTTLTWQYDKLGHVTSLEQSGTGTDYSRVDRGYDGYGQMTNETTTTSGGVFSVFSQQWNAAGRRTQLASATAAWNFDYRADGLLTQVGAFGQSYGYGYANNGLLNTRTTPDRTWAADQRDGRGRVLQATTSVGGNNMLVETMHWRANSTLNDYTADRSGSGTWDETRNYVYNARGQLTAETLKPSVAGSLAATYGYDSSKLGVLTGAAFVGTFTNVWDAPTGQPNGFGRLTQEQWSIGQWERWTHGRALGASNVTVSLDSQAVADVRYSPLVPDGSWEARLRFGQGTHTLRGAAYHPSGLFTNCTTNTFTAPDGSTLTEQYDGAGNVTNRTIGGDQVQSLAWDSMGRLISVMEKSGSLTTWVWTASYDGFGRRLQTRFQGLATTNIPVTTISQFYDPQVEFLEVGVSLNGTRSWKIHGPDLNGIYGGLMGVGGLEAAVLESNGTRTGLINDFFGNGVATIGSGTVKWATTLLAGYGPVPGFSPPWLSSYQSLAEVSLYRSKRIDPTGYYWLGARYYEPRAGRFLSPDPLGHAGCWDLYSYAHGDPLNGLDPDGRLGKRVVGGTLAALDGDFDYTDPDYINMSSHEELKRWQRQDWVNTLPPSEKTTVNLPVPFLYNSIHAYNSLQGDDPLAISQAGDQLFDEGVQTLLTLGLFMLLPAQQVGPQRPQPNLGSFNEFAGAEFEAAESGELAAVRGMGFDSVQAYRQAWAEGVVQERTAIIGTQLGRSAGFGETYGVAVTETFNNDLQVVISSKSPYGLSSVNNSLLSGEQYINRGLRFKYDAELQLMHFGDQVGGNTLAVGATRRVCPACQLTLDANGIPIATVRK